MPLSSINKNRCGGGASGNGSVSRPWDRPGKRRKQQQAVAPSAAATAVNNDVVPSIQVDGISYFSDRFYLAASEYDNDNNNDDRSSTSFQTATTTCSCNTNMDDEDDAPLLNVSRLVASLSLKAAIVGTFSLDTEWFLEHFPSLVRIPTLVLHGQRGHLPLDSSTMKEKKISKTNNDGGGDDDHHHSDDSDESSVDSMASEELYTQPEETLAYARAIVNGGCSDFPPSTLHFSKVTTKWVPPIGGVATAAATKKPTAEFKAGVHHPKFFLLWETSGSLVVVVSTGNLTPRRTIDGLWMQRFESRGVRADGDSSTSDFGTVLQNLLSAQTHALQVHNKNDNAETTMTPYTFCRQYLGWKSLDPIASTYDYSTAQVHLVATVPGLYNTPDYGRQRVAQVLRQISSPSSSATTPWLPPKILLTASDRLIIQPTSFGEWTRSSMTKVVESYLTTGGGDTTRMANNDANCLERLDIVWPTERFIQQVRAKLKALRPVQPTPSSSSKIITKTLVLSERSSRPRPAAESMAAQVQSSSSFGVQSPPVMRKDQKPELVGGVVIPHHERRSNGGYMFLSSTNFNKTDMDCLARMVQWQPTQPSRRQPTLVSHLKTIVRVLGEDNSITKQCKGKGANDVFSWIMMTSACLSRGAQGEAMDNSNDKKHGVGSNREENVSYANFELGVLFCSRLQHKSTDRIYCWKQPRCMCGALNGGSSSSRIRPPLLSQQQRIGGGGGAVARLIPLPIPYRLDAERYQLEEDDLDFCETPYFHEITPDTACVGNMRATPFGEHVARKREDRG